MLLVSCFGFILYFFGNWWICALHGEPVIDSSDHWYLFKNWVLFIIDLQILFIYLYNIHYMYACWVWYGACVCVHSLLSSGQWRYFIFWPTYLSTQNDAKDSAGLVPRTVLAQNRSWANLLKESVKEPKNQLTSGPDNLDSNLGLITQQRWTEEMWMLSLNYKVTDAPSSATLSSVLEVSTTSRFWLDLSDGASEYPLLKT